MLLNHLAKIARAAAADGACTETTVLTDKATGKQIRVSVPGYAPDGIGELSALASEYEDSRVLPMTTPNVPAGETEHSKAERGRKILATGNEVVALLSEFIKPSSSASEKRSKAAPASAPAANGQTVS